MAAKKTDDDREPSPWLKGVTGVKGVVPPGRRLSPATEKRASRWSASGVTGVRPPGRQRAGEGPTADSAEKAERRKALRTKDAARALDEAKRAGKKRPKKAGEVERKVDKGKVKAARPVAGFEARPFDDVADPAELKSFLELIADFFKANKPGPDAMETMSEVIVQSRAPFDITVAFTVLSVLVGKDANLRRRYTKPLERGAKVFFNLSARLDSTIKAPRGLNPQTVDSLFHDVPDSAYAVPYAFATAAFCRMIEVLRGADAYERVLVELTLDLRKRFIEGRALGDRPLFNMFPWVLPTWAEEFAEDA